MIAAAIAVGFPALALRWINASSDGIDLAPGAQSLIFGAGIVGAAFLLAWASEVAQLDISQGLALAVVALIAVLPEYSVDFYLAWRAGQDPSGPFVHYAAANMTGANRLLIGLGWSSVALVYWIRRHRGLALERPISLEIVALFAATVIAFIFPFFREIVLWAAAILILIFVLYLWLHSKGGAEPEELVGPAAAIAGVGKAGRRAIVVALALYAASVIVMAAKPFADGLIETGKVLNLDEFLLIQWIAPLASEAPEMLVALLLAVRGNGSGALILLVSAQVNQWSLLVGSLPVVYSISLGQVSGLPLDNRQVWEVLLTAAQSLFAVVLLLRLRLGPLAALFILALFTTQLVISHELVRHIFSFIYIGLAVVLVAVDLGRVRQFLHMARSVAMLASGRRVPEARIET
ncbi:MAG: sodium:calcium antiporter [Chloroflexi bacterium]|nr:sodium:calcium antiporter [Chloroflexota bacterium]